MSLKNPITSQEFTQAEICIFVGFSSNMTVLVFKLSGRKIVIQFDIILNINIIIRYDLILRRLTRRI